jgi:hypothetical protein
MSPCARRCAVMVDEALTHAFWTAASQNRAVEPLAQPSRTTSKTGPDRGARTRSRLASSPVCVGAATLA